MDHWTYDGFTCIIHKLSSISYQCQRKHYKIISLQNSLLFKFGPKNFWNFEKTSRLLSALNIQLFRFDLFMTGNWDLNSNSQLLNLTIHGSLIEKYLFCLEPFRSTDRLFQYQFISGFTCKVFLWTALCFYRIHRNLRVKLTRLIMKKVFLFFNFKVTYFRPIKALVITELRYCSDHRFTGPDYRFHALRQDFFYYSSLALPSTLQRSSFQPFHM